MAALLFIVSGDESRTYTYVKRALAKERIDVIIDRRNGDRRRRDVAKDLETSGWALVRR